MAVHMEPFMLVALGGWVTESDFANAKEGRMPNEKTLAAFLMHADNVGIEVIMNPIWRMRVMLGMNYEEFAGKFNVTAGTAYFWERGMFPMDKTAGQIQQFASSHGFEIELGAHIDWGLLVKELRINQLKLSHAKFITFMKQNGMRCSRSSVKSWESGRIPAPRGSTKIFLIELAMALNIDPNDIRKKEEKAAV
jgi:DNA-binding transcriptional regulator YiaG